MAYATTEDITALYGADALYVADRDGDGVAEIASVERALVSASAEMDGYLAVRYDTPLDGSHPILTQLCVDIALYRLANAADVTSETIRTRYDDAISSLKRLSKGEMNLRLAGGDDVDGDGTDDGARPIVTGGPARLFSRDKLRDF